jgi:hypothetical protein
MFSDSQGFTVNGGTFNNITHHHTASVPAGGSPVGTRMIPLEDIDLRHEIRVDRDTGVVERAVVQRVAVRRVYSARIEGRKSKFMVAIYQGDYAQEVRGIAFPDISEQPQQEWRGNIGKYTAIRQVSCIVRSSAPELYRQTSQYCSDLWGSKFMWYTCYNFP